jgi:hypothetical protein
MHAGLVPSAESCSVLPPTPPPEEPAAPKAADLGSRTGDDDDDEDDADEAVVAETLNSAIDVPEASAGELDARGKPPLAEQESAAPLRALSSLLWPPEPEDAEGEGNPLDRDQPKPLRRDELLAIGPSLLLPLLLPSER